MCECAVCQVRFNKLLEKKQKSYEVHNASFVFHYGVKGRFNQFKELIPYDEYHDKLLPLPQPTKVSESDYVKRCLELGITSLKESKELYQYGEHTCNSLKAEYNPQPLNQSEWDETISQVKALHNVLL